MVYIDGSDVKWILYHKDCFQIGLHCWEFWNMKGQVFLLGMLTTLFFSILGFQRMELVIYLFIISLPKKLQYVKETAKYI